MQFGRELQSIGFILVFVQLLDAVNGQLNDGSDTGLIGCVEEARVKVSKRSDW